MNKYNTTFCRAPLFMTAIGPHKTLITRVQCLQQRPAEATESIRPSSRKIMTQINKVDFSVPNRNPQAITITPPPSRWRGSPMPQLTCWSTRSHLVSISPTPSRIMPHPSRFDRQNGRWSYSRGWGAEGGLQKKHRSAIIDYRNQQKKSISTSKNKQHTTKSMFQRR